MHVTPRPQFGIEPDLVALARIASREPLFTATQAAATVLGRRIREHKRQQCEIADYALTAPAQRAVAIEFAQRHHAERLATLCCQAIELGDCRTRLAWADNNDLAAAGGHVRSWN